MFKLPQTYECSICKKRCDVKNILIIKGKKICDKCFNRLFKERELEELEEEEEEWW